MRRFAVVIPAAGSSTRFGGGRNKLLEPLAGEMILPRTIRAFARREDVALIVVPSQFDDSVWSHLDAPALAKLRCCPGGATRAHSVWNAMKQVPSEIEWVAVHDAARPLVSQPLIDRTFQAAIEHGAAAPALPVSLTVKQADGPLPARVLRTVPRQSLWAMQTPQAMSRLALLEAFKSCPIPLEQVTDDAQVLEAAGREVWLVEGEERNLKITTAMDLLVAETLLRDSSS